MKMRNWMMGMIVVSLFLVGGCQGNNPPVGSNDDPMDHLEYLSGYPDQMVPLYQPVVIDSSRFSVRDSQNYVLGKDLYFISFESAASREELSEYYQDLLDELDEELSYNEYSFQGSVQEYRVMVMIPEQARDQALGTMISLTVGMPPGQYVDQNPYFEDYPEELMEVFGFYRLQEYTYSEDYLYDYARFAIIYQTRLDGEAVIAFYREKYQDKTDYQDWQEGETWIFTWEEAPYRCMVRYDQYPHIQFIQLLADKDL